VEPPDSDEEEANKKGGLATIGRRKKEQKEEEVEKKEEEEMKEDQVYLKPLFTFECPITEKRNVSSIDINVSNPDLIAVGYGETDINCTVDEDLKPGLLCFWTLKNPKFPEKIIKTDHSITCCQFSKKQPHLIAVGDSHGNIAIYNVRDTDSSTPVATSKDLDGKHTDIVWEIHWVQRDTKGEFLVSISGDGRIIEWSMRKGLEMTELKQLKRETNPNQKNVYAGAELAPKNESITFLPTGGISIDFPGGKDPGNIYFVATEDCSVHKCSTTFSERYQSNYFGHAGPIYRVRCNPFWDSNDCPIFITCSYDWTINVWHEQFSKPKMTCSQIESLREQVNDICWSPMTSSVFASVANDGRIVIWDLTDHLTPILPTYFDVDANGNEDHTPRTVVKFS